VQFGTISKFGLMEMSRQRLRPALSEGASIPCPRCGGSGHIRDTESSALQILRIIQEESMKDSTASVLCQVPVDVASFLLNEKRSEIAKIEMKQRINVLLVPNKTLETPNYKLERLKHDDPRLDNIEASYKMAEEMEDPTTVTRRSQEKHNKQEPVIKGVLPDAPAPQAIPKPAPVVAVAPVAPAPARAVAPAPAEKSFFAKLKEFFVGAETAPVAAPAREEKKDERSGEARRDGRGERSGERNDRGGERGGRDGRRGGRGGRGEGRAGEARGEGRTDQPREARGERAERGERGEGRGGERRDRGERGEGRAERPATEGRPEGQRPERPAGERNEQPREPREAREPREPREPRGDRPEGQAAGAEGREGRGRRGRGGDRGERGERGDRAPRDAEQQEQALANQAAMAAAMAGDDAVRQQRPVEAGADAERQDGNRNNEARPEGQGRRERGERGGERGERGNGRRNERRDERADGSMAPAAAAQADSFDAAHPAVVAGQDEAGNPVAPASSTDVQPRAEGEEGGDRQPRERRSRDRYGRDRRERSERGEAPAENNAEIASAPVVSENFETNQPAAQDQPAPAAPEFVAQAEPVRAPQVAPQAAPVAAAPVAVTPPVAAAPAGRALPKVQTYDLPLQDLAQVAQSSGLQWVNSDAAKIAEVQAAMAAEPKPIHVPRERAPAPQLDSGPLVLVETKRDLRDSTLPFENAAAAAPATGERAE
jgi:ribonuclease E